MLFALALLLLAAAVRDIQTRRIPNAFIGIGIAAGLAGHVWLGGGPGLLWSLAGLAGALPGLLLYAVKALGAGDVKLLMAVGALMGPVFLGWTALGAIFAGAAFAVLWLTRTGFTTAARSSSARRMPFAPAIALGAAGAFLHLHGLL